MKTILFALSFIILGGLLGIAFDYTYLINIPTKLVHKKVQEAMHVAMPTPDDGPNGMFNLTSQVNRLFMTEQFDQLDELLNEWNQPDQKLLDGRWKLSAYKYGLEAVISNLHDWNRALIIIQHWKDKNPKSPALALTTAIYWKAYAWDARGSGYANSVTEQGGKLFQERLQKAQDVLQLSKEFASDNPLWYQVSMEVGIGLNIDKQKIYGLFKEGIAKQKLYTSLYSSMVRTLEPKWGGNWDLVDKFIQENTELTKNETGHMLYAWLYWFATLEQGDQFNLFRDTAVSWPEMKQGFEDIVDAYPKSYWDANNFASFACRAGDKETFSKWRSKIEGHIMIEAWPSSYSLDVCEHKYLVNL